ncbi:retrovirus-related pol polyprotein from transposon TNT 1-94 [Tanacetum coccineum]
MMTRLSLKIDMPLRDNIELIFVSTKPVPVSQAETPISLDNDNENQVVHSDVSFVPNDAVMIITNDIYEKDAQCVTSYDTVNASLTAELARYKELAEMRMISKYRNVNEESLQKELHSVKIQLNSTLNHNKLIREEVSTLKLDFKQKENKLLEEFMDMKHLKEKVAIGYKNPFYLSKAKQVQPALYNGHEIVKTNHARALVHDSEDTLEIAETTRKQIIEKIKDPECVKKRGNTIRELKEKILRLQKKHSEADPILDFKALDSQNKDLNAKVKALQDLNERFRVENKKVKQYYKELYDSIKLTRAKTIEKSTYLLTKIKTLKAQIRGKMKCVTMHDHVKPKALAPGMYDIDVEPIPPCNRNNREVHLDYLKHLKESMATLCEIVEEAKVEKPLDCSLASACLYTKHSQELLEYVISTCPKDFNKRDRKIATAPLNRKKRVTFVEPGETLTNNSQTHVEQQTPKKTNAIMIPSAGVNDATVASGSKPRSNTKKDRTFPAKSDKKKVEDHSRNNKSSVKQKNRVDSHISYKRTVINLNSNFVYKACKKCLMSFNHDTCVVKSLKFVKKPPINKWQPTGRKFTLREYYPLTRFTESKVVHVTQPKSVSTSHIVITERLSNTSQKPLTRHDEVVSYLLTIQGLKEQIMVVASSVKSLKLRIFHQKSIPGTPQQNGIVERWNRTLVEAARTMLIFSKAQMTRTYFVDAWKISSGLVPDSVLAAPYVPPTNKDLEILFQPMFDEYFEPPGVERPVPPAPVVQVLVVSTSTPSSTIIHQDAPSTSYSPSSSVVQPPISHQGVIAGPTINDNPLAQVDNDPFLNMFAQKLSYDESSSRDVSSAESTQVVHPYNHIGKWSKDHPLDNVIRGMIGVVSGVVSCCGLFKFVL